MPIAMTQFTIIVNVPAGIVKRFMIQLKYQGLYYTILRKMHNEK